MLTEVHAVYETRQHVLVLFRTVADLVARAVVRAVAWAAARARVTRSFPLAQAEERTAELAMEVPWVGAFVEDEVATPVVMQSAGVADEAETQVAQLAP